MKSVSRLTALVLLALWGLATTHCDLEAASAFEFLACDRSGQSQPHDERDCGQDGCAVVESGLYKLNESRPLLPAPPTDTFDLLLPLDRLDPQVAALPDTGPGPAPPELRLTWQFSHRAAPAARAPSCIG